ncbi:hypothetical protein GCM10025734_68650 [Kitasatospora paranensis]
MIVGGITAAAALTLTLTACSSSGTAAAPAQSSAPAAQPAPAGSSAAPGAASPSAAGSASAPKPAGGVATPNMAQNLALIAGLKQIDPNLAKDQQGALAKAQATCGEIKAGKDDATVAADAAASFSGNGTTLTAQQGQMIAVIVKAALCP